MVANVMQRCSTLIGLILPMVAGMSIVVAMRALSDDRRYGWWWSQDEDRVMALNMSRTRNEILRLTAAVDNTKGGEAAIVAYDMALLRSYVQHKTALGRDPLHLFLLSKVS